MSEKKVLFIGGSDCSVGAGLFADMETAFKLDIPGCVAVTSVTAQNNTHYLKQSIVESALLRAQIQAVDQSIGAIKIGMLPDSASIEIVSDFLEKHLEIPSVLDPVFFSSTGANLFSLDSLVLLKSNLLSKITLLTPNAKEAAIITGCECSNLNQTTLNADEIVRLGARAVLIKGGHIDGAECIDTLVQKGENTIYLKNKRIAGGEVARGTGCRLASAIACYLCKGDGILDATQKAKEFVRTYIKSQTTKLTGQELF